MEIHRPRSDVENWYRQLFLTEPSDMESVSDQLWSIAHSLAVVYENPHTAVHLVTGLRWDDPNSYSRLMELANKLKEECLDRPTLSEFKSRVAKILQN